jgi:23S rRNA-intervening sequence protein
MAWQKTLDFAVNVYEVTRNFPQEELYAHCLLLTLEAPSHAQQRIHPLSSTHDRRR